MGVCLTLKRAEACLDWCCTGDTIAWCWARHSCRSKLQWCGSWRVNTTGFYARSHGCGFLTAVCDCNCKASVPPKVAGKVKKHLTRTIEVKMIVTTHIYDVFTSTSQAKVLFRRKSIGLTTCHTISNK
eukprot:2108905-Amphidinium_carterae.1